MKKLIPVVVALCIVALALYLLTDKDSSTDLNSRDKTGSESNGEHLLLEDQEPAADSQGAQAAAEAEETLPTTPPLLEGRVLGEKAGVAGATVLLFPVAEIEALMDRAEQIIPTNGTIPNIPLLVSKIRQELNTFKKAAIHLTTDHNGDFALYEGPDGGLIILTFAKGWLFDYGDVVSIEQGRTTQVTMELDRGSFIRGQVIDVDGEPLAGVTVLAEYRPPGMSGVGRLARRFLTLVNGEFLKGPFERKTDSSGKFNLDSLPPGTYDLVAFDSQGIENYIKGVETGSDSTVIYIGQGASLSGILTDSDGRVLEDIEIELQRLENMITLPPIPMIGQFSDVANVLNGYLNEKPNKLKSQADGSFHFGPLGEGSYRLSIEATGYFSKAQGFSVSWNEQADVGVIILDAGERIAGIVLDDDGNPLEGAQIMAISPNAERTPGTAMKDFMTGRSRTLSDAEGLFSLGGLVPGKYNVIASCGEFAPKTLDNIDTGSEDLEFSLERGLTATGVITSAETEQPIANVYVSAGEARGRTDKNGRYTIHGILGSSRGGGFFGGGRVRSSQDGSEEESVRIRIRAKGYLAVKDRLLLNQIPESLDFELSIAPTISGIVLDPDNKPIAGALVRLTPAFPPEFEQMGFFDTGLMFLGVTVADMDGRFVLDKYTSFNDLPELQIIADFPNYSRGKSEEFTLDTIPEEIQVSLILGGTISGIVTGGGQPIAGASVRLIKDLGNTGGMSGGPQGAAMMSMLGLPKGGEVTHADGEGLYTFKNVTPGDYKLEAEMVGFMESAEEKLQMNGGDETKLDFSLDPGAVLMGSVLDQNGYPIEGAKIRLLRQNVESANNFFDVQRIMGGAYKATTSNADGNFELVGLTGGFFTLITEKDGYSASEQNSIRGGDNLEQITLLPAGELHATVTDIDSREVITQYRISVRSLDNDQFDFDMGGTGVDDSNGFYKRSGLKTGNYQATIRADGYIRSTFKFNIVGGEISAQRFEMEASANIQGVVISDKTGKPIQGATVRVELTNGTKDDAFSVALNLDSKRTDAEGRFTIDMAATGSQRLIIDHPEFISLIKENLEADLRRQDELTLRMKPGLNISGQALDSSGNPSVGTFIFLSKQENPAEVTESPTSDGNGIPSIIAASNKSLITDENGYFSIGGLKPGKYLLQVPNASGEGASMEIVIANKDLKNLVFQLQ